MSSVSADLSPSPTPRTGIDDYFLAEQEPAPQPPSLAGFFFFVVVAAGLASAAGIAAAGLAGAAGDAAGIAAGLASAAGAVAAAGVAGVLAAMSVPVAVAAAAGAGEAALPEAGDVAGGVDPPQAATPSAAAAKPKIRFRRVMSMI
jgi:hypothetical protein